MIVGRELHFSELRGVSAAALAGSPQVVVVEGFPGIGKSAMVRSWTDGLRGWRIAHVRLDPEDAVQAYGAVRQALLALSDDVPRSFDAADAAAIEVFRALDADAEPVCIRIEDAQWIDPESEQVFLTLARQSLHGRQVIVIESRPADSGIAARLRRRASVHDGGALLSLEPLQNEDVDAFFRARLRVELDAATLERLVDVTGGFPVYLDSLARRIEAGGRTGRSLERAIDDLLRTYGRADMFTQAEVRDELASGSEGMGWSLLVLALAEKLRMTELRDVMAELGATVPEISEFRNHPLVSVDSEGDLRPRHGIIADCIENAFSAEQIRRAHAALAPALADARALRHRYLLNDGAPAPELAAELMTAANEALREGKGNQARRWAFWAANLAPGFLVPAVLIYLQERKNDRLEDFGPLFDPRPNDILTVAYRVLLRPEDPSETRSLDGLTPDEVGSLGLPELLLVAQALFQVGKVRSGQGDFGAPRAALATMIAELGVREQQLRPALAEGAPELIAALGGIRTVTMLLRTWQLYDGLQQHQIGTLADRLQQHTSEITADPFAQGAVVLAVPMLVWLRWLSCDYVGSRDALVEARPVAEQDQQVFAMMASYEHRLDFFAGRWDEAHLRLRRALGSSLSDREEMSGLMLLAESAMIPLCRGEHDFGSAAIAHVMEAVRGAVYSTVEANAAFASAWGTFANRGPARGIIETLGAMWASPLGGTYAAFPTSVILCRALIEENELARAWYLVESLDGYEVDKRVYRYASAHCSGLIAAAEGRIAHARSFFGTAREILRGMDSRPLRIFEAILAEDAAILARDAGNDRPETVMGDLVEAVGLLRRVEAVAWADALGSLHDQLTRSDVESLVAEQEPALLTALTSRERDIALRVENGLSNREIADEDVVSVRTVEYHVSNILRKTQMKSRVELRHHLRDEVRPLAH